MKCSAPAILQRAWHIPRRSFLKGYGQARGCPYPAREVTPAALAALEAQAARDKAEADRAKAQAEADKQRARNR